MTLAEQTGRRMLQQEESDMLFMADDEDLPTAFNDIFRQMGVDYTTIAVRTDEQQHMVVVKFDDGSVLIIVGLLRYMRQPVPLQMFKIIEMRAGEDEEEIRPDYYIANPKKSCGCKGNCACRTNAKSAKVKYENKTENLLPDWLHNATILDEIEVEYGYDRGPHDYRKGYKIKVGGKVMYLTVSEYPGKLNEYGTYYDSNNNSKRPDLQLSIHYKHDNKQFQEQFNEIMLPLGHIPVTPDFHEETEEYRRLSRQGLRMDRNWWPPARERLEKYTGLTKEDFKAMQPENIWELDDYIESLPDSMFIDYENKSALTYAAGLRDGIPIREQAINNSWSSMYFRNNDWLASNGFANPSSRPPEKWLNMSDSERADVLRQFTKDNYRSFKRWTTPWLVPQGTKVMPWYKPDRSDGAKGYKTIFSTMTKAGISKYQKMEVVHPTADILTPALANYARNDGDHQGKRERQYGYDYVEYFDDILRQQVIDELDEILDSNQTRRNPEKCQWRPIDGRSSIVECEKCEKKGILDFDGVDLNKFKIDSEGWRGGENWELLSGGRKVIDRTTDTLGYIDLDDAYSSGLLKDMKVLNKQKRQGGTHIGDTCTGWTIARRNPSPSELAGYTHHEDLYRYIVDKYDANLNNEDAHIDDFKWEYFNMPPAVFAMNSLMRNYDLPITVNDVSTIGYPPAEELMWKYTESRRNPSDPHSFVIVRHVGRGFAGQVYKEVEKFLTLEEAQEAYDKNYSTKRLHYVGKRYSSDPEREQYRQYYIFRSNPDDLQKAIHDIEKEFGKDTLEAKIEIAKLRASMAARRNPDAFPEGRYIASAGTVVAEDQTRNTLETAWGYDNVSDAKEVANYLENRTGIPFDTIDRETDMMVRRNGCGCNSKSNFRKNGCGCGNNSLRTNPSSTKGDLGHENPQKYSGHIVDFREHMVIIAHGKQRYYVDIDEIDAATKTPIDNMDIGDKVEFTGYDLTDSTGKNYGIKVKTFDWEEV